MFTPISYFQQDTQLVSTMYRTHKALPASCKISSLYVFDALARAARQQVIKHNLSERHATGNCATFLSKVAGVLEGLFQDILATGLPEAKVSFAGATYECPMHQLWKSITYVLNVPDGIFLPGRFRALP